MCWDTRSKRSHWRLTTSLFRKISDRPSTLDTTSLPFVFAAMELQSVVSVNMDDIEEYSIKGTALPMDRKVAKPLKGTMPLSRDVIKFP